MMMRVDWPTTSPLNAVEVKHDAADALVRATDAFNRAVRDARSAGWNVSVDTKPPEDWQTGPGDVSVFVSINRLHY